MLLAFGATVLAGGVYLTGGHTSNGARSDAMFDFATLARRNPRNSALYADPGDAPALADHAALRLSASPDAVFKALTAVLDEMPRTTLVGNVAGLRRLHAVQRSALFRFPDDIHAEVRTDGSGTRVLLFSASRYGEGDFGVNGRRLEGLATTLATRVGG